MIYHICPICDQKMKSPHYCDSCKRWIKNPLSINVDYYLNERHPEGDHDCTYHDSDDHGTRTSSGTYRSASGGQTYRSSSGGQTSRSSGNQTARSSSGSQNRRSSSGSGSAKNSAAAVYRLIIAIVIIIIMISTFCSVLPALFLAFGQYLRKLPDNMFVSRTPESSFEAEYESWAVEESDVIAAGVKCTGFGHMQTAADDVSSDLLLFAKTLGRDEPTVYHSSDNSEDSYGFSRYDTIDSFIFNDRDYIVLESDTATGQLHTLAFYWQDADSLMKILEETTSLLRKGSDWPLSEKETSDWLGELAEQLPDTDYDTVTPDAASDRLDICAACDDDGCYISISCWYD